MKNHPLRLEITINSSEPRLLEGLDLWLQMGLIGESQVRWLAKHYLVCALPEPVVEVATVGASDSSTAKGFAPETVPPIPQRPNVLAQVWQSFRDEISIRWFLFLGLLTVVGSSAGLAALSWQRIPEALQYGILWAYTLMFWGVGVWAARQDKLQLTAQTLQSIALLLIPLNFWAMDGLGRNPLEWLTVAIASISLTSIYFLYRQSSRSRFLFFNFIGLSYLHLGWEYAHYPLIAVYIGIIATAIVLRALPLPESNISQATIGRGFVVYALSVLLVRAIFIIHLPIQQLGLAIGVCGWLSQGTEREEGTNKRVTEVVGAVLLLVGWLVCIGDSYPWQAMAVSLLALHFFAQRLRRDWLHGDLLAIFIIGLQALILIGRLIPKGFRREALDLSVQIAHSEVFPWTVYGITLFPYVVFFVWLAGWLYRREKTDLAFFAEWLTFILGIVLTIVSLFNPTWRSLNLFCSTLTLVYVVHRRSPVRVALLYFTHLLGLVTLYVAIDWWFPSLSLSVWASLFLGLMVVEWGIYTRTETQRRQCIAEDAVLSVPGRTPASVGVPPVVQLPSHRGNTRVIQQVWGRSCWHVGFLLAGASYFLLWNCIEIFFATRESQPFVLFWLLAPLCLTGVAIQNKRKRRRIAALLSGYALIAAQLLTVWQPGTRLLGFAIAAGLMFVNSIYFRHPLAAAIQIGFSLSLAVSLLWGHLSESAWFLFGAIAISMLWSIAIQLRQKRYFLASIYRTAADAWAIFLCAIVLLVLSCKSFFSYVDSPFPHWHYFVTPIIIGGAIFYRYRQQLSNRIIYSLVWAVELVICEGVLLVNGSSLAVATVNTVLGLFALPLTNFLLVRQPNLVSLKSLPLLISVLGIGWRLGSFNDYTGMLTLGAAWTGIRVGCRFREQKIITYFSLVGITFACYELVLYQMLQASGGSPADGLTILAFVAAAIALLYRFLVNFLRSRNVSSFLNLSLNEIKIAAHSHWALGSLLKIAVVAVAVESVPQLRVVSIAVSVILATYAVIQGRDKETRRDRSLSDWWVYVGLVEFVGTIVYARAIWEQLIVLDPFRVLITCAIALLIYQIPWRSLGWESNPWHRFSLVIPAVSILITIEAVSYLNLLVVAAFYIRIAIRQREIRWSYISLGFIDWAIARFLVENSLTDPLWYASTIGLSLLYIAQFDPTFKQPENRNNRHALRLFGSGIICAIALLFHQDTGLVPTLIGLTAVFIGLGLQIRSFLFMGTATFILTGFYQLVVLSFEYPLAKWLIGITIGIILLVIAATFERWREDITRVLQNWLERLNRWE